MGTRLLIDEEPLQVLPSLAVAIGLNEAIILQQLHYWLKRSEHTMEGMRWIYNTYEQWRTQFPFWSHDTIKRAVHRLEALELIVSSTRFNRNHIDKTKWYRIDYDRLHDLCTATTVQDASTTVQDASTTVQDASTTVQDAPFDGAICTLRRCNLHPLPETSSETSSEREEELSSTILSGTAAEGFLPETPESQPADAHATKRAKKAITPLAPDDWIWQELQHYRTEFDIDALNDEAWWSNVEHSFLDFTLKWVKLAFADLARWLQENPKRRSRTARGWKQRMGFSLNFYYNKHVRREGYGKAAKPQARY